MVARPTTAGFAGSGRIFGLLVVGWCWLLVVVVDCGCLVVGGLWWPS